MVVKCLGWVVVTSGSSPSSEESVVPQFRNLPGGQEKETGLRVPPDCMSQQSRPLLKSWRIPIEPFVHTGAREADSSINGRTSVRSHQVDELCRE